MRLPAIDRKILNCIQEDIPLESEPFKILAQRLRLKEAQLLQRIKQLKAKGIIRCFAAGLNHRKLGFEGSLIAFIYKSGKLKEFLKQLSQKIGRENILVLPIKKQFKLRTMLKV